ncbi:MAG: Na+:H+ antiporter, NhaA family [Acidimicrobiaceae bacterium]|nr:Na+:H+ antiporter, NhaA family [Acidimicrobiaceae bacterium]
MPADSRSRAKTARGKTAHGKTAQGKAARGGAARAKSARAKSARAKAAQGKTAQDEAAHGSAEAIARRVLGAGRGDRSGGIGLAAAAAIALVWANWPGSRSYDATWSAIAPWSHALGLKLSVRDWINDGLMVGFFTLVGLEIRRETSEGELRSGRRSASPILAAGAGMVLPALIYLAAVQGHPGAGGWGIPMATDVAFALGALALVAPRGSGRTRVFLMTLAVADDIGSVIVLVAFYSADVAWVPLVGGLGCLAAMGILHLRRLLPWWACVALGALSWWAFVNAGVEPAVVGVAVGLCLVPLPQGEHQRGERLLEPFVNLAILPLFALANVGLRLVGSGLGSGAALRVLVAVAVARLVGKPVAIAAATLAVTRLAGPGYDPRLDRRAVVGVGALASIGFTVPLLIIRAALPDGPLAAGATAGLLIATALGFATGAVLFRSPTRPRPTRLARPGRRARGVSGKRRSSAGPSSGGLL